MGAGIAWPNSWRGRRGALSFVHDLFRGVAYEGLSFKRRREVHARVGEALERRGATVSLLAVHFFRAEEYERAWRYAVGRTGCAAALRKRRCARAVPVCARGRGAPRTGLGAGRTGGEALGDVADLAARYDDAESAYARARDLYGGDVEAQARLLGKEGMYASVRGGTTKRWIGSGTGSTPSNVPVPREDW